MVKLQNPPHHRKEGTKPGAGPESKRGTPNKGVGDGGNKLRRDETGSGSMDGTPVNTLVQAVTVVNVRIKLVTEGTVRGQGELHVIKNGFRLGSIPILSGNRI